MKQRNMKRILFVGAIAALNFFATCAESKTLFTVAADRPDCRYDVGETVTYTVTATDEKGTPLTDGKVSWSLDNFGSDVIAPRAEVDLAAGNHVRNGQAAVSGLPAAEPECGGRFVSRLERRRRAGACARLVAASGGL